MRVADVIFSVVSQYVDTVFFVPGGGAAFLVDALGQSGLRAVSALHEQGAGYMAVSYAMQRGLGVCLVTSGPGVTNAMTPCLGAYTDSVPVLFLSGQVPTDQMARGEMRCRGVQECPTEALVTPITKYRNTLFSPGLVDRILTAMIDGARQGRPGPVWLDVPQNIQALEVQE